MSSYPKYYLKTSIQVSTASSTAPVTYILKKKRRTKSRHKRKKARDTKRSKSKKKITETTEETF